MIARSPHPDVVLPDLSLPQLILSSARARGQRPALIDAVDGRSISYDEMVDLIERCATGLNQAGIGKGDVVGIYSLNTIEYPIVLLGIMLAGATATTVNALMTADEVARQLRDCRARMLVTSPVLVPSARRACEVAGIEALYCMGDVPDTRPLSTLLATPVVPPPPADPSDVAVLPYSSGTTGLPKGVMLTHRNLVANVLQVDRAGLFTPDDVVACVLPMFHIYGMTVVAMGGLHAGATVVVFHRFDPSSFPRALRQYRVTLLPAVPPIVAALAAAPAPESDAQRSYLREIFSGAAPIAAATIQASIARFGCQFGQGYGMTEASPVTHLSRHDNGRVSPIDSVGVCVSNTECRIVDPLTSETLGVGGIGEICVRGPQVMKGYLDQPAATAVTIDEDGWLHTGDIGRLDAEGNCYVVDRLKELIKCNAYQVAPAELEAILVSHPQVRDAAVIPMPDLVAGEVPKALVVARTSPLDCDDVLRFVAARVAPYKRIRAIEVVTEIPRAASGKILRRVLIERDRIARSTSPIDPSNRAPSSPTS